MHIIAPAMTSIVMESLTYKFNLMCHINHVKLVYSYVTLCAVCVLNIVLYLMCFFSRYRWLCYINPNFYGFSASTVILLSDFQSDCEINGGSELECYTSSGKYILDSFSFNDINPYQNILVSTTK